MTIGTKIKNYRLNKEWTQEQLGDILNVSRSTISGWETGRNYPDIETLIEISDLFSITIDTLLREDDGMVKAIDFNQKQKSKLKISIVVFSAISLSLVCFTLFTYLKQPSISFGKEVIISDVDVEPFERNEIKEINVKNNVVTIIFQSSLEGSYYGYMAGGGGGEVIINLYKKKVPNDDSLKYDGTTRIELGSMPRIKHLTFTVK